MSKLKSFKEILNEYIPHLEEDINWDSSENGGSLLLRSVAYMVTKKEVTNEDRDLAKKTLDILLEYGADPAIESTLKPNLSKISPIELASYVDTKLYEYLLNRSLEIDSSTESFAFEASFKEGVSKLGELLKKAGVGVGKTAAWALNLPAKAASKLASRSNQRTLNRISDKAEGLMEEKGLNPDMNKVAAQKEALKSLPSELVAKDKALAMAISAKIAEEGGGSKSQVGKAALSLSDKVSTDSLSPYKFLLDPKFGKPLSQILSKHGAGGLEPKNCLQQLKIIAYFIDKGLNVEDLRSDGQWKSLGGMAEVINNLNSPLKKDSATGKEILSEIMKKSKLTWVDLINYLKDGLKIKNSAKLVNNHKEDFSKILDKNFRKTMEDDDLVKIFKENVLKTINNLSKTSDSNEFTQEQRDVIEILKQLKYKTSDAKKAVSGLKGSVPEISKKALLRLGGNKK